MSAAAHSAAALLAFAERGMLALRITLAMAAAGLLLLAVLWQAAFPGERALTDLVAGAAPPCSSPCRWSPPPGTACATPACTA